MSKFHLAEPPFYTLQGEGKYTGVPSVFLRTFGCNFRCRTFARDPAAVPSNEKYNPEVKEIVDNLDNYNTIEQLPLVSTGCDSYLAVYPEFKRFVSKYTLDQLVDAILDLLPNRQWNGQHLVITGGEPLLGWQKLYSDLFEHYALSKLREVTFETNGTQELTDDFAKYLYNYCSYQITFSVSPKLSCSGESRASAIKPKVVCSYQDIGDVYLKFVVQNKHDVDEVLEVTKEYRAAGFRGHVYLMAVGGVEQVHQLNSQSVADLALQHGLRYSDRLQVGLWKNQWST